MTACVVNQSNKILVFGEKPVHKTENLSLLRKIETEQCAVSYKCINGEAHPSFCTSSSHW